jgi:hypothetical protein
MSELVQLVSKYGAPAVLAAVALYMALYILPRCEIQFRYPRSGKKPPRF